MTYCTRCGTPRAEGTMTCARCGRQFEQAAPEEPPTRADDSIPAYQETQPTTWDYGLPHESGPQVWGTGYYDEPQRLPGEGTGPFWNVFAAPPATSAPPEGDVTAAAPPPSRQEPPWRPASQPSSPAGSSPAGSSPTGPGPSWRDQPLWQQPTQSVPPWPPPPRPRNPPQPEAEPAAPVAAQPAARQPGAHRLVPAQPAARPSRRSPSRPPGTIIAAAALLVLACGGGAYALATTLAAHTGKAGGTARAGGYPNGYPAVVVGPTTQPVVLPSTVPPSTAPKTRSSTTVPPTTAPPTTVPPTTVPPTTVPPTTQPVSGSFPVTVSSAAQASPAEQQVATFVSQYFTVINNHDYNGYVSLLDATSAANESQSSFTAGFGTTTDSAATLTGITDLSGGGEAASLTFTSNQASANGPNGDTCDNWSITLFLSPSGGGYAGYVIGQAPAGYQAQWTAC